MLLLCLRVLSANVATAAGRVSSWATDPLLQCRDAALDQCQRQCRATARAGAPFVVPLLQVVEDRVELHRVDVEVLGVEMLRLLVVVRVAVGAPLSEEAGATRALVVVVVENRRASGAAELVVRPGVVCSGQHPRRCPSPRGWRTSSTAGGRGRGRRGGEVGRSGGRAGCGRRAHPKVRGASPVVLVVRARARWRAVGLAGWATLRKARQMGARSITTRASAAIFGHACRWSAMRSAVTSPSASAPWRGLCQLPYSDKISRTPQLGGALSPATPMSDVGPGRRRRRRVALGRHGGGERRRRSRRRRPARAAGPPPAPPRRRSRRGRSRRGGARRRCRCDETFLASRSSVDTLHAITLLLANRLVRAAGRAGYVRPTRSRRRA